MITVIDGSTFHQRSHGTTMDMEQRAALEKAWRRPGAALVSHKSTVLPILLCGGLGQDEKKPSRQRTLEQSWTSHGPWSSHGATLGVAMMQPLGEARNRRWHLPQLTLIEFKHSLCERTRFGPVRWAKMVLKCLRRAGSLLQSGLKWLRRAGTNQQRVLKHPLCQHRSKKSA